MRMRKKKHGAERIAACSELLIEDTSLLATLGEEGNPIFTESRPIHMEIGCGKGGFAGQYALQNPDKNIIALDIKIDMLGVGRRTIVRLFEEAGKGDAIDNLLLCGFCELDKYASIFILS